MWSSLKKHWPLPGAILFLAATLVFLLIDTMVKNDGILVYALDDAYIHMAVAKNLADYGVWGISPDEFTSTSSSPLYTVILTLIFDIFGPQSFIPFIIGSLSSILLLVILYFFFKKEGILNTYSFLLLVFVIIIIPLPALIFTGMEHIIQIVLNLVFLRFAGKIISDCRRLSKEPLDKNLKLNSPDDQIGKIEIQKKHSSGRWLEKEEWILLLITPLVVLVRFEGFLLVAPTCLLLMFRKRFLYALLIGLAAFLPIIGFGIFSIIQGGFFFPNSILIKSGFIGGGFDLFFLMIQIKFFFLRDFTGGGVLTVLIFSIVILFCWDFFHLKNRWSITSVNCIIFCISCLLHVILSSNGWFFRYEAYLVLMGIYIIIQFFSPFLKKRISPKNLYRRVKKAIYSDSIRMPFLGIGLFLIFLSTLYRGVLGFSATPFACTNIYQQQVQMGRFLHRYYTGSGVAANDIGAINYFADIYCLDVVGLGTNEVLSAKQNKNYTAATIRQFCLEKNVSIAIVYDSYLGAMDPSILDEWIEIGEWKIPNNVICGSDTVSFYAVSPTEDGNLRAHLIDFNSELPTEVQVTIFS